MKFPAHALSSNVYAHCRVNEAHGASERFRAALEASAKRRHRSRRGAGDGADGAPGGAESWGSVWKALIRVHSLMMLRVRHVRPGEGSAAGIGPWLQAIVPLHWYQGFGPRGAHEPECFAKGVGIMATTPQPADATRKLASKAVSDNFTALLSTALIALFAANEAVCCAQSSVLIFVSDCCSFAGPVLLQQLLEFLEDRSSIGECGDAVFRAKHLFFPRCCDICPRLSTILGE